MKIIKPIYEKKKFLVFFKRPNGKVYRGTYYGYRNKIKLPNDCEVVKIVSGKKTIPKLIKVFKYLEEEVIK